MADSPGIPIVPNTPILNRIKDNNPQNRDLPRGACNYHDKGGQRCGCLHYFDETYGRSGSGSLWFCLCEHHACFHNQGDVSGQQTFSSNNSGSQNLHLGNGPQQQQQHHTSESFLGYTDASNTQIRGGLDPGTVFPILQNSLPDTLPWNSPAQPSHPALPPIPPQCLFPSQERIDRENEQKTKDTQSSESILSNERRAFADLRPSSFLRSQNKAPPPTSVIDQQKITSAEVYGNVPRDVLYHSQGQLGLMGDKNEVAADLDNGGGNLVSAEVLYQISSPIRSIRREVSNLSTIVQAHGERLDLMENSSFSTTDSSDVHGKLQERQDEIEDKFLSAEIRQDEFDGRLIEIERFRDNESSRGSVPRRIGDNDSFTSSVINAASDPTLIVTLRTQISDLQSELQAAIPPTRDKPWTVEVIILPFGSSLKGIWSTIEEFPSQVSRRSSMAADDCVHNQLPSKDQVQIKQCLEVRSGSWEGVVAKHNPEGDDLLVARSCNRNSKIYARLKSRGCIRTVQITGPQAKDVNSALLNFFGDLAEILCGTDGKNVQRRQSRLTKPYHAFQSSWLPLRKLHKDSRLRFLDSSELISQTLWTVEFLKSSVVMRATGLPILFLTHPQGYTQHLTASEDHWTWPSIRLMPRINLDSDENEVKEGDANEPCWQFDERFDLQQSVHSSFTSMHSLSIRQAASDEFRNPTSHSDHFSSAAASPVDTPTSSTQIVSPIPESRNGRAKLRRTTSVPVLLPLQERPSLSKRKTSYYPEVQSKLSPVPFNQKRRRISRSPSRPRNTPRWSTGPQDYEEDIEITVPTSVRGTTPFCAYATPHSTDFRAFEDEDDNDEGSTTQNAEFDIPMDEFESSFEAAQLEDAVWEGVEDGSNDNAYDNGDDSSDSSDSSGAPSEYPSTQPQLPTGHSGNFDIYVDEDDDDDTGRRG